MIVEVFQIAYVGVSLSPEEARIVEDDIVLFKINQN